MSNGLFGLRRRVLLSFLLRLLLLSLGLIRKNERGLAGTHQLQLLANLQLLRGRIFLQLLNAVAPILILALQIGDKRSRDLLLTGRLFDAEEAYRLGLVNEVIEPVALEERVRTLAESLAANSPQSQAATKRLLAAQNKAWLDTAIEQAMEANALARETADFREGIAAFIEKRKPVWSK